MSEFVEFKMRCDTCDQVGTCASQNIGDVSVALVVPAGWQIKTWSFRPGMATDLRIQCPDCAMRAATHHESWKAGVVP